MTANLIVHGYRYDGHTLGVVEDLGGRRLQDAFWNGEEVHVTPDLLADWPGMGVGYAFRARHDQQAQAKMQGWVREDADEDEPVAWCWARQYRERPDGSLDILGDRDFPLFDLDDGHGIDRITSFMWHWHAEVFGDGLLSKRGVAQARSRQEHAALREATSEATVPKRKRRVRL